MRLMQGAHGLGFKGFLGLDSKVHTTILTCILSTSPTQAAETVDNGISNLRVVGNTGPLA